MFSLKPKFILILAVISGLLGSFLVYKYLQQKRADDVEEQPLTNTRLGSFLVYKYLQQKRADDVEEQPLTNTRLVVVASRDLPVGTTINPDNIEAKPWPVELMPLGTFENTSELVGRVIKTDTYTGEPVLLTKLAPEGSIGGVSSLIPTGMRAITVAVNVVSGVSGFILPNAKVDILATLTDSEKEKSTTKIVLQDVLVLAIDQTYKKDDDDPVTVKSVTLLLSPEDAEKLALASNECTLQMALRNSADSEIYETDGTRLSEVLGRPKPVVKPRRTTRRRTSRPPRQTQAAPPPKKAPRVVEIIRSDKREEATFEEQN
jgi:pilus assembly protein CpaB